FVEGEPLGQRDRLAAGEVIVQNAPTQRSERADEVARAGVAAADLEEALEPRLGKQRRQVKVPVAVGGVVPLEALAQEAAKRHAGSRNVAIVAIHEKHRYIEGPLGVRAKYVAVRERKRQQTTPIGIGIEPNPRAVALMAA